MSAHRFQFILGFIELLNEFSVKKRLIQNYLLQSNSESLQVAVDVLECLVELK